MGFCFWILPGVWAECNLTDAIQLLALQAWMQGVLPERTQVEVGCLAAGAERWMIEILHDFIYQNIPKALGIMVI